MKMNGRLPEDKYADCANGYRIHYIDQGEGEVVVFLHGSGPGASGHSNFKGNYPDRCSLEGCDLGEGQAWEDAEWVEFLPQSKLKADHEHHFISELAHQGPFTHVRMKIYPDGGISRLRLFGNISS